MLQGNKAHVPQLLSLRSKTQELQMLSLLKLRLLKPLCPRPRALQQEEPLK